MSQRDLEAERAVHRMRRHALLFAGVNTGFLVADLLLPGPVWFVYPLVFWGAGLAMHVFYVRAIYLDSGWAESRTRRLRRLSYDHEHIAQIEAAPRGAGMRVPNPEPTDTEGTEPCRRKT